MDGFQRKGTVSRPSGPTYIYSYALKGVSIKYAPPIFVPDILNLPAGWKHPQMFSEELFRYDYSGEQKVLEHGRQRALSVAAQAEAASLSARMVEAARQAEKRQTELESASTIDSPPHPPIIPPLGSTILTPTPVGADGGGAITKDSAGEVEAGGGRGRDGGVNVIKSLGQMSIREFEGDNNDPFEIASLQAINDMEVLQSVLQPTVCTTATTPPSPGTTSTSTRNSAVISTAPPPSTQVALSQSRQTPTQAAKLLQMQIQSSTAPPVVDLATTFCSPLVTSSSASQQQQQPPPTIQQPPPPVQPPSSIQQQPPPPTVQQQPPQTVHQQPPQTVQQQPPPQTIQQQQPSPSILQRQPPLPLQQQQPPVSTIPALPVGSAKNPFLGGPLTSTCSTAAVSSTNPFSVVPPVSSSQSGGHSSTNPFMVSVSPSFPPSQQPVGAVQEPSVGTLIEIEPLSAKPQATTPPVTRTAPTPVPRGSPVVPHGTKAAPVPVPRGHPATTQAAAQTAPVPIPRGQPAAAVTQTAPIPVPRVLPPYSAVESPHTTQPQSLHISSFPNGPVPFIPDSAPQASYVPIASGGVPPIPPKPSTRGTSPAVPHKGTKVSQPVSGISTTSSTTNIPVTFPPVHNRLGLGVPVLPPIPHTSSAPHLSHSPILDQPDRRPTPPPPYFAEQEAETRRRPPPRPSRHPTYKLPDPKGSLSIGERKEVESITAMGFPSPRVARTVKRLGSEDRTKILDFLILVGRLEDIDYNGDSAETALLVSDEDFDKALDYLKRLDGYKDIGFIEKTIHEAYNKAKGDWDQALDFLTQGR